jgi:hypothetical protein
VRSTSLSGMVWLGASAPRSTSFSVNTRIALVVTAARGGSELPPMANRNPSKTGAIGCTVL